MLLKCAPHTDTLHIEVVAYFNNSLKHGSHCQHKIPADSNFQIFWRKGVDIGEDASFCLWKKSKIVLLMDFPAGLATNGFFAWSSISLTNTLSVSLRVNIYGCGWNAGIHKAINVFIHSCPALGKSIMELEQEARLHKLGYVKMYSRGFSHSYTLLIKTTLCSWKLKNWIFISFKKLARKRAKTMLKISTGSP